MTFGSLGGARTSGLRPIDRVNLLAAVVGLLAGFFIITGTVPVLFALPVLTALGIDGVLCTHPAGRLRSAAQRTQQALLPSAFVVSAALFFRYVASGYWEVLAALGTTLMVAGVAYAEYGSLDAGAEVGDAAHVGLLVAAYAELFAFFAVFYSFDLSLVAAAALSGIVAAVVAVELVRDLDLSSPDLAIYVGVSGIVTAQIRWAAGFIRLDGLLAAMFLLLVFYELIGVTLAALHRRFDRRVAAEYAAVGVVGVVILVIGRLATGS